MFCKKCGKKLEDGVKFCTYCGCPVSAVIKMSGAEPAGAKKPYEAEDSQEFEKKKFGGLNILIAMLAVLLVICLAAAGVLFFKPDLIRSIFGDRSRYTGEESASSFSEEPAAVSADGSSEASTETYADAAPTGSAEDDSASVSEMNGDKKVLGDSADDASGVHSYYIVAGDIDFNGAFDDAINKGTNTYLAHINSQE